MAELKYIPRPDNGRYCRYWKAHNSVYGKCTLPANKGEWCNAYGWINTHCPLPGYDYEVKDESDKKTV